MRHLLLTTVLITVAAVQSAGSAPPEFSSHQFKQLHAAILPQPGESPWREVQWHTNITEARQRAIKDDKPLIIFTAADGSPLGRT
ncbi:MAG: hypothetical protein AAF492_14215 [Verrucomicrobiota bacterium]